MPGPITGPKERDLARIKAGRHVTHIYPFKYAKIVLAEDFSCWDQRIGARNCSTPLVASATGFKLAGHPPYACHRFPSHQADHFIYYQAHGLFRVPVEGISQASIHIWQKCRTLQGFTHIEQTEKPVQLLILAESHQVAQATDYPAKQSASGTIAKIHGIHQY